MIVHKLSSDGDSMVGFESLFKSFQLRSVSQRFGSTAALKGTDSSMRQSPAMQVMSSERLCRVDIACKW